MTERIKEFNQLLKSRRGKNIITFLIFLAISTVLWIVQSINEEMQRDLHCKIVITHVPDSLTRISKLPEDVNVSVRANGTQLMKFMWSKEHKMDIDYRQYKLGSNIVFSEADLKAYFRNKIGGNAQILSVTPDSLSIAYTSAPGMEVPVKVDSHISTAPQYVLVGQPKALLDSVTLYSLHGYDRKIRSLSTVTINLSHIEKSTVIRVPLIVPKGCRAIPDSVDVSIAVEPLISKTKMVRITPKNVPEGMKLIPTPSQVEVFYMVPMSVFKKSTTEPNFIVEADYADIAKDLTTNKIPIRISEVPKGFSNVFLSTDSIEYLLEQ